MCAFFSATLKKAHIFNYSGVVFFSSFGYPNRSCEYLSKFELPNSFYMRNCLVSADKEASDKFRWRYEHMLTSLLYRLLLVSRACAPDTIVHSIYYYVLLQLFCYVITVLRVEYIQSYRRNQHLAAHCSNE